MKHFLLFIITFLAGATVSAQVNMTPVKDLGLQPVNVEIPQEYTSAFPAGKTVNLPAGFKARVFYANVSIVPRFIHFSPSGVLHISNMKTGGNGSVCALPDSNKDGVADTMIVVASGFSSNHDFAFYKGALYVTEPTKVWKCMDNNSDGIYETKTLFIDHVGDGTATGHFTRTIVFDSLNQKVYISVGSSCNVCRENERAIIEQYDDDGFNKRIFATGIRNGVGMKLHPVTNRLWTNNNGSDKQGNETPPEWIDVVRDGGFYGHPFAYASQVWFNFEADADYKALKPITANDSMRVSTMIEPAALIRAHTAPLGLEFLNPSFFQDYRSGFITALHGSWNTTNPNDFRGYSLLYGDLSNATDTSVNFVGDFCTGFLTDTVNRVYWARPVGLAPATDGSLFMSSDDVTTFILHIYPDGSNGLKEKLQNLNSVSVYPNPSVSNFNVAFEVRENSVVSVELYDLTGKKTRTIMAEKELVPGQYAENIEWKDIPSGWYMVKINTPQGVITRKIQKL